MNKNRRKEFIPNFRHAFIQAIINRFLQHLVAKDDYHRLQYFKSKRIKGTQKDYHSSYTLHSSFLPLLRFRHHRAHNQGSPAHRAQQRDGSESGDSRPFRDKLIILPAHSCLPCENLWEFQIINQPF